MTTTSTSAAPVQAYYHQGRPYHAKCLLEKLTGYPVVKSTPPATILNRLRQHGGFMVDEAVHSTPACAVCEQHLLPGHRARDYVMDGAGTYTCLVCWPPQPHVADTWQHTYWHTGGDKFIHPDCR